MKGRATESNSAMLAELRAVSHLMKPSTGVALLRAQHGEERARKIALMEQRRARRARSKRRLAFCADVAARIENGTSNNKA